MYLVTLYFLLFDRTTSVVSRICTYYHSVSMILRISKMSDHSMLSMSVKVLVISFEILTVLSTSSVGYTSALASGTRCHELKHHLIGINLSEILKTVRS